MVSVFFTIDKTLTAAHYIKGLLISGMQAIVEQRIFALPFEVNGVQQDWNVRVFVTRDADNHYIVGGMLVRSDSYGKPVNLSISAHVMLFEDVMRLAKVSDEEHEIINQKIDEVCVRATMHVISDLLEGHPAPVSQQQDWMGIDIMVAKEGSEYVPYIIELNNEDSGGMWEHDKLLSTPGRPFKGSCTAYIDTIVRRAEAALKTGQN